MTIAETIDSSFTIQNHSYSIIEEKESYLLKTIHIPKSEVFSYAFLGGMWYSKNHFGFSEDTISLPYPFTSYYTLKILDKKIDDILSKSAIYVKMPVFVIQFSNTCYLTKFDPYIHIHDKDIFPFIQLKESEKSYDISFYLDTSYTIKQKEHAWLGRGKKSKIHHHLKKEDTFNFFTETSEINSWQKGIFSGMNTYLKQKGNNGLKKAPKEVFSQAKHALWRSYDHMRGTFLQLPWRDTLGFTFVNSSYSLTSYEAVRLNYFSHWYQQTKDEDFARWMKKICEIFINPAMHTTSQKKGTGIIWYNMTTLTKKGLSGYFYMDTGYSGYPGGQATIDLHLLEYLRRYPHSELEKLVHHSLQYIISTQKEDGSWPMAIKQQGLLKFRPEKLHTFTTHGGTAEATRALLKGSVFFNDDEMNAAAKKGLLFLMDENPICYNGLRDIGIMEPEAFSAVSIIDVFLDAYEQTNEEKYLHYAKTYAAYTIPWIYQWGTAHLPFMFNFHPISASITPRLSPYETAWIISTFYRLAKHTQESLWTSLNKELYNHVITHISSTGGLSEGIFPQGFTGFKPLPMEQTFATVELMKSAETLMDTPCSIVKTNKEHHTSIDDSFHLEKDNSILSFYKGNELLLCFDASKATITHLASVQLNEIGITFSFYRKELKSGIKRKMKQHLRGNYGKFLIGAIDARYVLSGVKAPEPLTDIQLDLIKNHVISSDITVVSNNNATVTIHTSVHRIQIILHFSTSKDTLLVDLSIQVSVKAHDLSTKQLVLFPVIGAKPDKISDEQIEFDGFFLSGDLSKRIQKESFIAINQTLESNWTHGGLCEKKFLITLPLEKK